ncbi:MAG: hypothetical protein FJ053_08790 [Cyanobacteria bacterium M_surface_10_m1_298]|nr:hypothetical protein [Cyanobacteria bacterium M_surface_10_m1_298]
MTDPQLRLGASVRRRQTWIAAALLAIGAVSISGCRPPDTQALKKIACEQAAASLDMQSVSQMDALRKALGVAPDVDPIRACTELGANMKPTTQPAEAEAEGEASN